MSDDAAPSRSADAAPSDHSYGPLGRPYKYKHVEVAPRPAPKTAFGFVLGPKCRMRWARWYHEMANGDELSTLPPEEVEEILEGGEMAIRSLLPGLIYSEFPNLPRLRRRLSFGQRVRPQRRPVQLRRLLQGRQVRGASPDCELLPPDWPQPDGGGAERSTGTQ